MECVACAFRRDCARLVRQRLPVVCEWDGRSRQFVHEEYQLMVNFLVGRTVFSTAELRALGIEEKRVQHFVTAARRLGLFEFSGQRTANGAKVYRIVGTLEHFSFASREAIN